MKTKIIIKTIASFAIMAAIIFSCTKEFQPNSSENATNSSTSRYNLTGNYQGVKYNSALGMLEFTDERTYESVMKQLMDENSKFTGDNGNTQALLDLLNSSASPGDIKNTLVDASPLTDTVLSSVIKKNLPNGITKEILLANVPFTDKIDNTIANSSLPNGIKTEITDAVNSDFAIENPVLDAFEQSLNFISLRKTLEQGEAAFLQIGGDPESEKNPDNHFVKDDYVRTFLNPQLEVKVGKEILKYIDASYLVVIHDGDLNTLNQIRNTGKIPRLTPPSDEPPNGLPANQAPPIIPPNVTIEYLGPNPPQIACIADFTFVGGGPNTINFTDLSNALTPVNYYWDFGDGFYSYVQNPSHTYSSNGTYVVTLTIVDGLSQVCFFSQKISIGGCGISWTVSLNFLTANFSSTLTGGIPPITYFWDFGDGNTSTSPNPTHTYATSGFRTVCLTITDATGCSATNCRSINPQSPAPPPPDECCDKNDKDKEVWNGYASNRKAKASIHLRNLYVDHYINAKTKNYKKEGGIWFPKKTDKISAICQGTMYGSASSFVLWHKHCDAAPKSPNPFFISDTPTNQNSANANIHTWGVNFADRIFLKQHSIQSNHIVKYNGTDYNIAVLFLTEDCD